MAKRKSELLSIFDVKRIADALAEHGQHRAAAAKEWKPPPTFWHRRWSLRQPLPEETNRLLREPSARRRVLEQLDRYPDAPEGLVEREMRAYRELLNRSAFADVERLFKAREELIGLRLLAGLLEYLDHRVPSSFSDAPEINDYLRPLGKILPANFGILLAKGLIVLRARGARPIDVAALIAYGPSDLTPDGIEEKAFDEAGRAEDKRRLRYERAFKAGQAPYIPPFHIPRA